MNPVFEDKRFLNIKKRKSCKPIHLKYVQNLRNINLCMVLITFSFVVCAKGYYSKINFKINNIVNTYISMLIFFFLALPVTRLITV